MDADLLGTQHEHYSWQEWRGVEMCGSVWCAAMRNHDGSEVSDEHRAAIIEEIRRAYTS